MVKNIEGGEKRAFIEEAGQWRRSQKILDLNEKTSAKKKEVRKNERKVKLYLDERKGRVRKKENLKRTGPF